MKIKTFVLLILFATVLGAFFLIKPNFNTSHAHKPMSPEGMAKVPSGTTSIGSQDGLANEQPVFKAEVESFYLDKDLVTVADFRTFVETTSYQTEAEKIGDAVVFNFERENWEVVDGANWQFPNGPDAPKAQDDHPVTQVSWNDAIAYLDWVGKRLPTEIEWEHAARGGVNLQQKYSWGDSLIENGEYKANTWTGAFPQRNEVRDGYLQTSPVGAFGATGLGLHDIGGNVWEWTESWYLPYPVDTNSSAVSDSKVLRGGSFMCHTSYCHGYRVSARTPTPPDNGLFHVGFRGAKSIVN